jgi:two-component system, OmpR family, sensor kinase
MARHFLQLYLLIVATLAAASWGQERLWDLANDAGEAEHRAQMATLTLVEEQLQLVPSAERRKFLADLATRTGLDLELLERRDIAGHDAAGLTRGKPALMSAADGDTWMLRQLKDEDRVLAYRYTDPATRRGPLDWLLSILFYAAIAFVIMMWLWPLTRDLRRLERATMRFGDRNWTYDADIKPRSQVFALAEAFRRMAARIDDLIGSHKDMSNAVSHEIKTPLARMRFEIEMARTASSKEKLAEHLSSIDADVAELNTFVTATLDYAILERAEVALNMGEHDFTLILPAIAESVKRGARAELSISCDVQPDATKVSCDAHLMETVVRNLLYNALRYARTEIRVEFRIKPGDGYSLHVHDDGPGIPEPQRQRVFHSFVQLGEPSGQKTGYGLGLAIVKRIVGWHGGQARVSRSQLGGADFAIEWPAAQAATKR